MAMTSAALWLNEFFSGYDNAILSLMHSLATALGAVLTPLMKVITFLGEKGIIFFLLALIFMCFSSERDTGVCVFGAVCCGALITNMILKDSIARPRPFETVEQFREWWVYVGSPFEDGYSFPSGHVTACAAGMTALSLMKGKKLVVPSVVIVLLMAISRNYLMAHYPSDVLVAAIIGVASGFIAWVITRFIFRFLEDRRGSMPIAELVLDFDIREVLPFDIPFIGTAPEKEPAPVKKAPLTVETIRNRRGPAFENRDTDAGDYAEPESAPRRSAAASRGGSHAKAEPAASQRFKLNLPSMPGAYKGKHEKK